MRMLITGANGQLGRELVRQAKAFNIEFLAPRRQDLDITRPNQVKTALAETAPSVVVNAAGYTNVDTAEKEVDLAFEVNKIAPGFLARCCADRTIALIHISSDYVFDGSKGKPYHESDPIAPLGIYGQSKAQGEVAVRSVLHNHIILRTSWLYSVYRRNFVKTMLDLGTEKKRIPVVADQFGSPTSAADLAETVLTIAGKIDRSADLEWGTYHYCGHGVTSWHGLANEVLRLASPYVPLQTQQVKAITTAEYPTPAKRPPYSALDCSRIKKAFGIDPKPWQQSLKRTIERIFTDND
ncbi:MAG: dTDP-4-dehydrorhamnose reductase [Desulfobacterales bacterium]